ncbi:hypothetical protein BDY19DRAFT_988014 [Irpex rosettiformis]|uniref:Uncharacterized protein n=1 Tax=Irpex rosettiformis TaxID=378272 RepID=A0ACB8UIK9_9APHY|nr:hypothetical protein BDY19DRAFT_988014 [Irpex rosettiformis]
MHRPSLSPTGVHLFSSSLSSIALNGARTPVDDSGVSGHTSSACIILGAIVFSSPGVGMAASALVELELALEKFAKGAEQSTRARQAYGILRDLKSKA